MAGTLARLSAVLAARGIIEVFAIIDHSSKARDVGLELRDTKLVIFGSPSATTPVIEAPGSSRTTAGFVPSRRSMRFGASPRACTPMSHGGRGKPSMRTRPSASVRPIRPRGRSSRPKTSVTRAPATGLPRESCTTTSSEDGCFVAGLVVAGFAGEDRVAVG